MRKLINLMMCLLFIAVTAKAQTLAFPTAEGFGKYASGGRGGEVVEVTNLLDDPTNPPEGSFRWALKQHPGKPITIVFRVSGIIDLKGNDLRNKRDNVTIAGQTAPGDGICIKGGCINLGGSRNLIIRHLRSRVGILGDDAEYTPGNVDENNFIAGASLNIENGGNFIIDHCSFSWSAEETVGFYDNDHTTMQWCIVSEALYNAGHGKGNRGYGAVWGGKTATYHHNLLAHNFTRSPRLGATTKNDKHMLLDIVNNVNYNYGKANACYGGDNRQGNDGLFQVNYVNNYYKPGPAYTGDRKAYFIGASFCNPAQGSQGTSYGDWHLDGNYMDGTYAAQNGYNTDNYKAFDISAYQENVAGLTLADMKSDHIDVGEFAVDTQSPQDAFNSVLEKAGAFPRDSHDKRVLDETKNGTAEYYGSCNAGRAKGIIDKPSDSGGYPAYNTYGQITDNDHDGMDDAWEEANGFDPTDSADRNTILKGGYTALEAYLCSLVGENIAIEKAKPYDIIVAQDGSGDCKTINEAIEMADENAKRTTIFVRNGVYNEKVFVGNRYEDSKKVISIIGESAEGVVITWDDYHGKSIEYPGKGIISADGMTAPTMTVTSPDFYMENVTVRNTTGDDVAQAEALYQAGDRQILKNVCIEGYQDSHRTKKGRRYFYYGCTVKGNVDFIYGGGTAYFYKSNIVSRSRAGGKSGGYITAPEDITYKATLENGKPLYYEFFFNDCDLTAENGASDAYLARPWADKDCGTVFMNTRIGSHINPAGWSGNGNDTSMSFAEYNSMNADGTAADMTKRATWGMTLGENDMKLLDLDDIYNAVSQQKFSPEEAVAGVCPPENVTNSNGFVSWSAVDGARGYVVYLNGEIAGFTDGNGYFDINNPEGTYTVRAIAANGALSPMSGTEYTLTAEGLHKTLNPHENDDIETPKVECTITATAAPADGGTVNPASVTCLQGESVTLTATPSESYEFKNWTTSDGRVYSTIATYTFNAEKSIDLIANFTLKAKELEYHKAVATTYEYEYIDATLIPEKQPNAATGKDEWVIKNEYTSWVKHTGANMNVNGRAVEIDPMTDELTSWYTFSTNNMIRVGQSTSLSFYVTGTKKAKIYFNGAASTPGHMIALVTPEGGATATYESVNEYGKKTEHQSDMLEFDVDETKNNEITLRGTQDMAVWVLKLWPGTAAGITDIATEDSKADGRIYNIQGQRVSQPVSGQIYIIGGKKVIMK